MANNTCPYCGNNPVPHFINWYFETSDVLLAPLRRLLVYNFSALGLKRYLRRKNATWHLVKILIGLKIVRLQPEAQKCKVRRAQVLWEEGEKRGIKMMELLLFGRPFDVYMAEKLQNRPPDPGQPQLCSPLPNVFAIHRVAAEAKDAGDVA